VNQPPPPAIKAPPPYGIVRILRRFYRSQRASVRVGIVTVLPLLIVGVIASIFSIRAAGSAVTFDVLIGARSAFAEQAGPGGVILAAVGYLILPALVSVLVTAAWERGFDGR
jgi:hypothetical protein